MNRLAFFMMPMALMVAAPAAGSETYETNVLKTSAGDLRITFIGHASLMFEFGGKVVYNDPVGTYGDFSRLPKADLILAAHEHGDHFDLKTIDLLSTARTKLVLAPLCAAKIGRGIALKNGEETTVEGIRIEAVPAYNLVHMRAPGLPYHPKGDGNGYILTFGDKRVYIAGDTENIPEMKALGRIDCAFMPMNLPYTMTPEMVADAAKMVRPAILYPYHTTDTDTSKLQPLLKGEKGIEIPDPADAVMAYRVFDHTADLGVEVTAATFGELYAEACRALFDLLADLSTVRAAGVREIVVSGEDPDDLLVNFLREALYAWSGEGFLIKSCRVQEAAPRRLRALLAGEPYDPARHRIRQEIKAVTYHQAMVRQIDAGWIGRVVFDV